MGRRDAVKAKLLLERRMGVDGVAELAQADSLADAHLRLAGTAYADAVHWRPRGMRSGSSRPTTLRLRILAAWIPPGEAAGWLLAAWFELSNLEDRLAYGSRCRWPSMGSGHSSPVWNAHGRGRSREELVLLLGRSKAQGEPPVSDPRRLPLVLRLSWAARVRADVPEARRWAIAATGILLAEEVLVGRHAVGLLGTARRRRTAGCGPRACLAARDSAGAFRFPLAEDRGRADLWRAGRPGG